MIVAFFVIGIVVMVVAAVGYIVYAITCAVPRGAQPPDRKEQPMNVLAGALAKMRAFFVRLDARVEAWWRSTQSTAIGAISVATGLFTNGAGALHDLGVAEAWIKHIAAALIVAGLVLVTPREKQP